VEIGGIAGVVWTVSPGDLGLKKGNVRLGVSSGWNASEVRRGALHEVCIAGRLQSYGHPLSHPPTRPDKASHLQKNNSNGKQSVLLDCMYVASGIKHYTKSGGRGSCIHKIIHINSTSFPNHTTEVEWPFENLLASAVIKASLTSNSSSTAPNLKISVSTYLASHLRHNLPIASDLGQELVLDGLDLLLAQILEFLILENLDPSHDRRNLPIKR
jgi:hypothetical protein